jgi:hypothetical protein
MGVLLLLDKSFYRRALNTVSQHLLIASRGSSSSKKGTWMDFAVCARGFDCFLYPPKNVQKSKRSGRHSTRTCTFCRVGSFGFAYWISTFQTLSIASACSLSVFRVFQARQSASCQVTQAPSRPLLNEPVLLQSSRACRCYIPGGAPTFHGLLLLPLFRCALWILAYVKR